MADPTDLIGRIFDSRYQITALVGRGGMGTVYKAVHVAMNQTVALKVLHHDMSRDERQVQRFYQEARASSRLKHPNTIKVFDFGRSDEGHLYLAMEFLEGETLTHLLRREGALPVRRALNIVRQVAKSLAEAHSQGLVHRDLKPDNIFITRIYGEEDFVKVLDFGIAKFLQGHPESGPLTQAGFVCGTPQYLSPEQALGRTLDGRSDLYSLGVILYEMLVGVPPFRAETPVALVMKHIHDAPPPLGHGVVGIPESVRMLVSALLDKDRDRRPPSAEALIRLLDETMIGLAAGTPPDPLPPPRSEVARVGMARTRIETLLPPREEHIEDVTRAWPVLPPTVLSRPAPSARARPTDGVHGDAATLHLSRSTSPLADVRSGPSLAEDEETVLVSLSGSGLARPLVAPNSPSAPAPPPRLRKVALSGPDDSTVIEPPSHVPIPSARKRPGRSAPNRWRRPLTVALVVVAAGATGIGVASLIRGMTGESDVPAGPNIGSSPPAGSGGPPRPEPSPTLASPEPNANLGPGTVPAEPLPRGDTGSSMAHTPPVARQVTLMIESVPEAVMVFLDNRKVGTTPLALTVREGDAPIVLRLVAEGYDESRLTIDPTQAIQSGVTRHRVVLNRVVQAPPAEPASVKKAAEPTEAPVRPAAPKKKKPVPTLQWE